jgi:site-specific recombinase XerC
MVGDAARLVISALVAAGELTPSDLRELALQLEGDSAAVSHREFVAIAERLCPPRSLSTYRTGFRRLAGAFGDRPLHDATLAELEALVAQTRAAASCGRGDGVGAARNLIHAARFFYRAAIASGYCHSNPASQLVMPTPARRVRRALTEAELIDVYEVLSVTGNDPLLDLCLLDFHRETACRRAGACGLSLSDIDDARPSVLVREKYGHEREVPASPQLLARIRHLAASRPGPDPTAAFRYESGARLTRRRYNSMFERVQRELPWAARLGVSIHWIRHMAKRSSASVIALSLVMTGQQPSKQASSRTTSSAITARREKRCRSMRT